MRKKSPNLTDQHVGSRVRMRRVMLKLSQTDLADGLGVSFQQVQKYEKGANRIGASRLQQIAATLQVPVEFFFEGAPSATVRRAARQGEAVPIDTGDQFLATHEGARVAKAMMHIGDQAVRIALVHLIEAIARAGRP